MKKTELKYPVTVGGEEIKELNMRRPKVRDSRAADLGGKSDADKEVNLFANLCSVSADVIDELDMADYTELQKVYSGFLA